MHALIKICEFSAAFFVGRITGTGVGELRFICVARICDCRFIAICVYGRVYLQTA